MMFGPEPGLYRHYKGCLYRVLHVGMHVDTAELFVVYYQVVDVPIEQNMIWVRPLGQFLEPAETPTGKRPRFMLVEDGEEHDAWLPQ